MDEGLAQFDNFARYSPENRARARSAYRAIEPYHVIAYFNKELVTAQTELDVVPHAWYVGARGAPLGECAPGVVASTFYNFNPQLAEASWVTARAIGLSVIADRRNSMLATLFDEILGDDAHSTKTTALADRFLAIAADLPMAGRALAAAWAQASIPEHPAVRLWHAIAIIREWRGDGHVAALTAFGFGRLEAVVFHEAKHPDPSVSRPPALGRKLSQMTRGWSDDDWDAATNALIGRNLVERVDNSEVLTSHGVALYDMIEQFTDDAAAPAWASVDDFDELMAAVRPYVQAVINSGNLRRPTKS